MDGASTFKQTCDGPQSEILCVLLSKAVVRRLLLLFPRLPFAFLSTVSDFLRDSRLKEP